MKSESDDKWNAFVQDGFSQFPEPVSPKREGRTISGEGKEQKKKPPQKEPQQNNAASAAAAGPRRVASKQVKKEAKAEQAPARQVADGQAKENEFHLDQVLEQAASKHWATREECFKRITGEENTERQVLFKHRHCFILTRRFAPRLVFRPSQKTSAP